MTSDIGSDLGLEKVVERQFFFHCSCGAAIETSATMVTCCECGETVEIRGRVPTAKGTKYTLRISKHRRDVTPEPFSGPLVLQPSVSWQPTRFHREDADYVALVRSVMAAHPAKHLRQSPDYNKRYVHLGLSILLSPLWVPLLLIGLSSIFAPVAVERDQSNAEVTVMPEPSDCGLFSGCHYDKRVVHINDKRGGHTVVTWQRVVD
jgi:hypothetical protein